MCGVGVDVLAYKAKSAELLGCLFRLTITMIDPCASLASKLVLFALTRAMKRRTRFLLSPQKAVQKRQKVGRFSIFQFDLRYTHILAIHQQDYTK